MSTATGDKQTRELLVSTLAWVAKWESRRKSQRLKGLTPATLQGIVALEALYFGTRISELIKRHVRELDDDGWLLWIPDSKTEAGRRKLQVPADLRPYLLQLAQGKRPDAPLFIGPRSGNVLSRHTAYGMVQRFCRLAGVPVVCPHGLRGTHGSVARENGATPDVVAASLGHSSYSVTAQYYVAPGIDDRVQQRILIDRLQARVGNAANENQLPREGGVANSQMISTRGWRNWQTRQT